MNRIAELEEQLAELPKGYISRKTINGKQRFYLQWNESGKLRSRYIKSGELEVIEQKIALRKELQTELDGLKKTAGISAKSEQSFRTSVVSGKALAAMLESVKNFEKRDCFAALEGFLQSPTADKVCLVYGLRRTGKTTMLRQSIAGMTAENFAKCAYIKAKVTDTMSDMNVDLKRLYDSGYRYIFIDEVTLIKDFIQSAALFSDVYAALGMKLVLSGTDSLGFWFASHQELYDRAVMVHTTFIPFREHSRLLKINSIDDYIRYGGTLRAGEYDFEDADLNALDASFRDDESTRRYIDTAICMNIQNSLKYAEDGGHFRQLIKLYEAGELTNAINRIIEDMNHRFVLDVLTKEFVSGDLGKASRNLRGERNPKKRTDILEQINKEEVTGRLMELLQIRNAAAQSIGITSVHISEIKEYLKALDLIMDCPFETTEPEAEPLEHILFTQPGMRYCQAEALIYSLSKDKRFADISEYEKKIVTDKIIETVKGGMMEDIVILETAKALGKRFRVFGLKFAVGEFDMVIYDTEENNCRIYEIKHSRERVKEQTRHISDDEKRALCEKKYGKIVETCVLYLGENCPDEYGVEYKNANEFLNELPDFVQIISQDMGENPVLKM